MSNTTRPERYVIISLVGSVVVIVGASAMKKTFPSARQVLATGFVYVALAGVADAKPESAGPLSGLVFASIALSQGLDFAHGLDNVKSYKGATKGATGTGSGVSGSAVPGAPTTPNPAFAPFNPPNPLVVTAGSTVQRNIVTVANQWLGVPYRWAGASRAGVDCSGLTMKVYGAVGIGMPHLASAQYHLFPVYKDTNPPPGAEVFFNWPGVDKGIPPGHCGIATGDGNFIHAPHTGDVVKVSSIADYLKSGAQWYGYTTPYAKGKP